MCRSKQSGAQAKNFQKRKNWQSKKVTEAENSESTSESDLLQALSNVLYLNSDN